MTLELHAIFEEATEEVLLSPWAHKHGVELPSQINNGGCDLWAKAVVRRMPQARIGQAWGHWFVVYQGAAYDADHWNGFAIPSEGA